MEKLKLKKQGNFPQITQLLIIRVMVLAQVPLTPEPVVFATYVVKSPPGLKPGGKTTDQIITVATKVTTVY